jgi:hypothetical protein
MNRYEAFDDIEDLFVDLDELIGYDEFDAMIDEAVRRPSIPGGQSGRARRDISPWPRQLNQARALIQRAIQHLGPPTNPGAFRLALDGAGNAIQNARREVKRVMAGERQTKVLGALNEAVKRINQARLQQALGLAQQPLREAFFYLALARSHTDLRLIRGG